MLERWLVAVVAVVLPIAYSWGTYDHYVIPKLLLARGLVLTLGILFAARCIASGRVTIKRTPLGIALIALLLSAAVSTAFSVNLNVSIFGTYGRYDGLLTLGTYVAMFWLVSQTICGPGDARFVLRALLTGGYVVAAVAILQFLRDSLTVHGAVRAYGTMGNSDILGAFLALLIPVAYGEVLAAKTAGARWLAINALVVMALALLLAVSRSAWLGVLVAAVVLVLGRQWPVWRSRLALAALGVAAAAVAGVAVVALEHGLSTAGLVSSPETLSSRLHVWGDTLPLIASRPFVGYGLDSFGLVYPAFQTGNWGQYQQFDKAHSELLQVAATQGALGVASYLWLLGSFVVAFWRGRDQPAAWSLSAGWVAYQVTLQLNFTAIAAAFPFWMFSAAAIAVWTGGRTSRVWSMPLGSVPKAALAALGAALVLLAIPALVLAYLADHKLQDAVTADAASQGNPAGLAADARRLAPQESVYAVEAGNIAFERRDWEGAREAYVEAARLGTFNPQMFRNLAFADQALGRKGDALAAARQAVYLDRFDPVNQAVLAQIEALSP